MTGIRGAVGRWRGRRAQARARRAITRDERFAGRGARAARAGSRCERATRGPRAQQAISKGRRDLTCRLLPHREQRPSLRAQRTPHSPGTGGRTALARRSPRPLQRCSVLAMPPATGGQSRRRGPHAGKLAPQWPICRSARGPCAAWLGGRCRVCGGPARRARLCHTASLPAGAGKAAAENEGAPPSSSPCTTPCPCARPRWRSTSR